MQVFYSPCCSHYIGVLSPRPECPYYTRIHKLETDEIKYNYTRYDKTSPLYRLCNLHFPLCIFSGIPYNYLYSEYSHTHMNTIPGCGTIMSGTFPTYQPTWVQNFLTLGNFNTN